VQLSALPGPAFHATKQRERSATVKHIRATLEEDIGKLTNPVPGR
jgi:hypothetical protein